MSSKRNTIRVAIVGEEYTIRSDASPQHTREVAEYVDRAIRRVMESGQVIESQKAAILAALQITDELFTARRSVDGLESSISSLSAEIRRWLPPGKREGEAKAERGEGKVS
jgi:cell division protein ZapA